MFASVWCFLGTSCETVDDEKESVTLALFLAVISFFKPVAKSSIMIRPTGPLLALLLVTTRCRWAVVAAATEERSGNEPTSEKRTLLRLKDRYSSDWKGRTRRLLGLRLLDDSQKELLIPHINTNNNVHQFPFDEEHSATKTGSGTSSSIRKHHHHVKSRAVQLSNLIVAENAKAGNPKMEWDLADGLIGDPSIQGFATDISVNKGNRITFKVASTANYVMLIYRLGYYGGSGARYIANATVTATLPQNQPACNFVSTTKTTDCGNWAESAYWDVPADTDTISGIYIAKLTRTDTSGSSHVVFVVRDDASSSKMLFKTSDTTWQAYNNYGGNSLYVGKASKVSYNRPFNTRAGGGGGGAGEDWVFNAEYPMVRWLERNGYDVTYFTDIDADRYGSLIRNHTVFLSVGHDEYWSAGERANVEAARDAGVHLAFFSGNEVYWKTRWESSFDGTSTAYRTLVCYKEG